MNSGGGSLPDARRRLIAPCFAVLFYATGALAALLLSGALYYLYQGFIRTLPAGATSAHGWTQLFAMLFGLVLLLMSLILVILLLALLRYRRFVYAFSVTHLPLMFAGIVTLLNAAAFFALAFGFFDSGLIVLVPAVLFSLLGAGWLFCYVRSTRLQAAARSDSRAPEAGAAEADSGRNG